MMQRTNQTHRIAVMMGGTSGEREVSLESGQNVLDTLRRNGYHAFAFDPALRPLTELLEEKPDKVFMILHGQPGEDGRYQAFLDLHRIPYTGSGMTSSTLTLDKRISKMIWNGINIPTAAFKIIDHHVGPHRTDYESVVNQLGSPFVIKPNNEGSSLGITLVRDFSQWKAALSCARSYQTNTLKPFVLAEQYIKGCEYTFAVVGHTVLPGVRIDYSGSFYDYHAKYQDDHTNLVCPCGLPQNIEKHFQQLSIKAADALYCKGWYRVDLIADDQNNPYFLEVNTAPGMTSHSLVPRAAAEYGWSYEILLQHILESVTFEN